MENTIFLAVEQKHRKFMRCRECLNGLEGEIKRRRMTLAIINRVAENEAYRGIAE